MNTITLNDQLKRALAALRWPDKDRQQVLNSPCLTLSNIENGGTISREEAENIRLVDEQDSILRTPFPIFRFHIGSGNKGAAIYGFAKRQHGSLFIFSFQRQNEGNSKHCFSVEFLSSEDPFAGDLRFRNQRAYDTKSFSDATKLYSEWQHRNPLDEKDNPTISQAHKRLLELEQELGAKKNLLGFLQDMASPASKHYKYDERDPHRQINDAEFAWVALHGILMLACYEYLAPYNFTAVVSPDRSGKSVKWIQAREHYTVIHRKHPANTVGFNGRVTESSAVIERLAHSRRAHTRLLKSARYTFKRGQRVPVRASWVGPKEWRDTAGQVYKILVPTDQEPLSVAA